jgi:L-iditol 2-dehydrogenase
MKSAVYHGPEDIGIEEAPKPEIGEDEVLVEMKACGVCGSDLMDWYLEKRAPLVLGHEPVGVVAEKGKRVKSFETGDRVFVHHHVADMTCHYCTHGDYTLCDQFHKTNIHPGGFSEYFRVPAPNLQFDTLKVPDSVSDEEGTFIEPVGCCLRAAAKCDIRTGDAVAVIGAGTTGILHIALARLFGAAHVIASDIFDSRLEMAKKYNADIVVNPKTENVAEAVMSLTNGIGADAVIITAPNLQAYETGLRICRRGGRLCVFAPTPPEVHLNISPKELFFSEVQIVPSYSTSHLETRTGLELIASGRLNVEPLVTHRFPLERIANAFKTARGDSKSLKVIVLNR